MAQLGEDTVIASGDIEVGYLSIGLLHELTPGLDDEEFDRRPQRRRYEEPLHIKMRKQLLGIAESVRTMMTSGFEAKLIED